MKKLFLTFYLIITFILCFSQASYAIKYSHDLYFTAEIYESGVSTDKYLEFSGTAILDWGALYQEKSSDPEFWFSANITSFELSTQGYTISGSGGVSFSQFAQSQYVTLNGIEFYDAGSIVGAGADKEGYDSERDVFCAEVTPENILGVGGINVFSTDLWVLADGTTILATCATVSRGEAIPAPEPATTLLFGSGLIGLIGFRKKFRK